MSDDPPLVLVVEDERDLSELYRTWLAKSYRVRTAHDGRTALDELGEDVDIVLLDRRMPDLSGDEVLDRIRERGLDCRVAMVTAVEPDVDIVEMAFDDYLVKPVTEEELLGTTENLRIRDEYDDGVKQLFSLASKKALLEARKTGRHSRPARSTSNSSTNSPTSGRTSTTNSLASARATTSR